MSTKWDKLGMFLNETLAKDKRVCYNGGKSYFEKGDCIMKTCVKWLAVTLAVVLLTSTLSGCVFVSESGGFQGLDAIISFIYDRDIVVVESDHFQVTDKELTVYEYQATQYCYQQVQAEYLYYQYGLYEDVYGITEQFGSAEEYAEYMVGLYREDGTLTDMAYDFAEGNLAYCEGALAEGFALAEDDTRVEDSIQWIRDRAEEIGISVDQYITEEFGPDVSEDDIRSAMEKYALYAAYADELEVTLSADGAPEDVVRERMTQWAEGMMVEYHVISHKDESDDAKFEFLSDMEEFFEFLFPFI